ncbi:MAG: hypothetical protein ACRDFB_06880 [Rhabdochlamydiaceae bacterium]
MAHKYRTDGWTSNNPVDWETERLRVWQIGQPEIHGPNKLYAWITNRFKTKMMRTKPKNLSVDILMVFEKYIKAASILSIDNPAIKTVEKGQHMGQQSGHQSGQALN